MILAFVGWKNDLIKKSDCKLYFYENGYCLYKYNQIKWRTNVIYALELETIRS